MSVTSNCGHTFCVFCLINWYFTDTLTGWTGTGFFNGTWWDKGAKLDLASTSSSPVTLGEAKRIVCQNCNKDGNGSSNDDSKKKKTIIIAAVAGGVGLLVLLGAVVALCLCCSFLCKVFNIVFSA